MKEYYVPFSAKLYFLNPGSKYSFSFLPFGSGPASGALYSHRSVRLDGILMSRQLAISLWKAVVILL